VLWLAHRRELLLQAASQLRSYDLDPGLIRPGVPARPDAQVQVASVASLIRREPPPADLVVVDECHLSAARTYQRILAWYPAAVVLGLTATPCRLDGRGLGETYEELVQVAQPQQLVAQGHLVRPNVLAPATVSLSDCMVIRRGDYTPGELARMAERKELVGDVPEHWLEHGHGPTVVYATNRQHARAIQAAFCTHGIPAGYLDGQMGENARAAALKGLEQGGILCSVDVLSEGYDLPQLATVVLCRPTQSLTLYIQQTGRCMRPPGPATVLDHVGNVFRHGLPCADRYWSLTSAQTKGRREPAGLSLSRCLECYAVYAVGLPACPSCGAQRITQLVQQKDGRLLEVSEEELTQQAVIEAQRMSVNKRARQLIIMGWRPGDAWRVARDERKQEV